MRNTAVIRPIFLWALLSGIAAVACAQGIGVGVSIHVAPPPLIVDRQPPLPGPGYLWTPGYWTWAGSGYEWVPGTWALAPEPGLLWTPGYWNWVNGAYVWEPGYWAPEVGFYGGVDYGFGYTGIGFSGGYWHRGAFYYNRAVNNFGSRRIATAYDRPVPHHVGGRISYHGGRGGIRLQPTPAQRNIAHQRHPGPTPVQQQHQHQHAAAPARPRQAQPGAHSRPMAGARRLRTTDRKIPRAPASRPSQPPAHPQAHPQASQHREPPHRNGGPG